MNKSQINFIVGLVLLFVCFKIFVGSGMFLSLYQPQVEAGKLGEPQAVALSGVWETIVAVVSAFGATGVFIFFKVADVIQKKFFPGHVTPTAATDLQQPVGINQREADMSRLLLAAVAEGDADMTIMLANKLNGTAYLQPQQKSFPKA